MTPIANMNVYNDGMRKSMLDKIWFLDKIDGGIDTIYDYGCADGSLLKIVGEICPSMKLIGYDISQEMIDIAKQNVPNADYLSTNPKSDLHNTILNASSVFHEIHAYSSDIEWDYGNIFNSGATYIAIRDMFYSKRSCHPTNSIQLAKVLQHENPNKVSEFEAYNGLLVNNKDFLHYLLNSIEEFLSKIPRQYEIVFYEHYTLPFLRDRVYEDFGFTLNDPTHAKILLRLIG